ncbi:MAG: DUF177 domain-containing protein [Candidatus Binatia bacterium]
MKIRVVDIKETEKSAAFVEDVREINEALGGTGPVDYQFRGGVPVDVSFYRLGSDLFFRGRFRSEVSGTCARCLESYSFALGKEFTFVLKPLNAAAAEAELTEEDLSFSFYEGDEVNLAPLVRETLLLALPTKPLCREDCRGLCPRCGANRNGAECGCREEWRDPRLEVLRTLKR